MAQQTALEWLEQQLLLHTKIENSKYVQQEIIDVAMWQFNKYIKQAKQMEKEQIIKAHTRSYLIGEDTISIEDANIQSEQYYNEIYGK